MPIKVIHVVRQYLPSIGGMEEVVRNIARHQLRQGQRPRILTLNRLFRNAAEPLAEREEIDGIEIIRLSYRGSSRYPLCPAVLSHLGDTDLIHVHGVDFFYDFLAATQWLHRRKLVLSTHGGFFHTSFASRTKLAYFNTVTRLSAKAYSKVVATSDNDGQLFGQIMSENKLQVIENGVDIEKYANQASEQLTPCLMYFGRWSANKGLLQALDLFARLHAQHPQWRLIIAGREYDHSGAELQARVNDLQLQSAVQLAANPSDEEIRQLVRQASYFLCLSRHEGFGIAPIEAMSAGLTPVLSDIPPFRRLIEASQLGFLADLAVNNDTDKSTEDVQNQTINQLLALHQLGQAAYSQRRTTAMAFAQRYAWPQVADRYLALYTKLGGTS
jgi:alpha-1,3-mannosyltransferase